MKQPRYVVPPLGLPGRSWWLLPASVILFAITFVVGLLAKRYGSPGPDLSLDVSIIPDRTTVLSGLALALNSVLSPAGNVVILLLICLVIMFVLRRPLTSLAFGSTVAVGWVSSEAGKIAVARLRPPTAATHALLLETGHSSFPSGHTAFASALVWGAVLILATHVRAAHHHGHHRHPLRGLGRTFPAVSGRALSQRCLWFPADQHRRGDVVATAREPCR